jgi:mannose-6-phosphate isomerase-like protein (cupin superfamily)
MIYKKEAVVVETRKELRGGPGDTVLHHLVSSDGLPKKCRLFCEMRLEPGCGIGEHPHNGETEFYYVLRGEGVVSDNGKDVALRQGDCMSTGNGESHSIMNKGTETLVFIACIVLD